jgi:hypothetical protein
MIIPDPGAEFFHPDPGFKRFRIRMKEFKYFNQKNGVSALGNMIRDVRPGFFHTGSRVKKKHRIQICNTSTSHDRQFSLETRPKGA